MKEGFLELEDENQTLDLLLRQWEEEGARALMKHGRETGGLRIFESKKAYLAHMRKVFDVGENAFNLLNRAAGLKQLDSVDTIFRELVLDDKSAFGRALEVASDFDNLAAIFKELEDARRQRDSLLPIAKSNRDLEKLEGKLVEARKLKELAPRWYAGLGVTLWEKKADELAEREKETGIELGEKQGEVATAEAREGDLHERFLALGGSDIEQLEVTIATQGELLKSKQGKAGEYQVVMRALELDETLQEGRFRENRERLEEKKPGLEKALFELEEEDSEARSKVREARVRAEELEGMIREVKASPGSNVPPNFQRFRAELAGQLGVGNDDLPLVAELVEVKPEEAEWRGAIERAMGANRLRILVPEGRMRKALRWVNGRDNRLHVRLQEARTDEVERDFFYDSYLHKLNRADHPLKGALENLLARQDYHCVADTEALCETDHGLTKEGTMSGKGGRFDKQDQRALSEGWLTGFDNKDQLTGLARDLLKAQGEVAGLEPGLAGLREKRKARANEIRLLENVLRLEFEEIDVPGVKRQLERSRERLARLRAPDSDTKVAQDAYETAREMTGNLREEEMKLGNMLAVLESQISGAKERIQELERRRGEALDEGEKSLTDRAFRIPEGLATENLEEAQRNAIKNIEGQIDRRTEGVRKLETRLVLAMEKARILNPGPYVDAGAHREDIPVYLEELKRLKEEALPEKEKRFLEYLNSSSDQGVTQLLAQIDQEVSGIEDRITELNHTLAKVDFRAGGYLRLQLKRLNDAKIRELERARRHLRDAVLKEDEGRSHFGALQDIVGILREAGNNRHLVGSRALLDPRYRLEFRVVEVNRETGEVSSERSGSQSGSGGEKELMSSHILTASLSYALCPSGASRPLYGTVVLDEAFSKSSQSAARLIVDALKVFGLYPVFVTPNKEISLLKKHTRRAICVQRVGNGSTLATITWEKLAELQPESVK